MQLSRLNLGFLLLSVGVLLVGLLVFRAPVWVVVLPVIALAVANVAVTIALARRARTSVQTIVASRPDALVLATAVIAWDASDPVARRRVIALVADRSGISLRDAAGAEVAMIPASDILAIDLAPLGRTAFRPFRIQTAGHGILDLAMSQVRPDDQVDAVVALRSALGRAS